MIKWFLSGDFFDKVCFKEKCIFSKEEKKTEVGRGEVLRWGCVWLILGVGVVRCGWSFESLGGGGV